MVLFHRGAPEFDPGREDEILCVPGRCSLDLLGCMYVCMYICVCVCVCV